MDHWPEHLGGPSFWHGAATLPANAPLAGDAQADVCIIGAGFTGLWAAHYLALAAPALVIRVIDAERPGFGASGRNGGWLTGGFAWSHNRYLADSDADGVRAMVRAMGGTVAEIAAKVRVAGIDADLHLTDEVMVAVNPAQMTRLQAEVTTRTQWGESGVHAIDAAALRKRIELPGALGAMVVPGVARIHPFKLVAGLARLVRDQGIVLHDRTRATEIRPGRVTTNRGAISAPVILRATEGFSAGIKGHHRDWLPLNSAQIVTAPLPPETWSKIGWQGAEILGDFANVYCYCQRTADGRITVGSRGVPYRFGSRTDRDGVPDDTTIRRLIGILHRHFPAAKGAAIDRAWCGTLGVPRDWCATVSFDPATGIGAAGGYVGVGVSTSNLAGRTLADLALGRATDLTRLPWVNRPVRKWEPEPLRWLALRGTYALLHAADRAETGGGGPSVLARLANRIAGR